MNRRFEKDLVQTFPASKTRAVAQVRTFQHCEDTLDQAVSQYWHHHGSAALAHQLSAWQLCLTRHEESACSTIRVDDCGIVTASASESRQQSLTAEKTE